MTPYEGRLFKLVDKYARNRYGCFLAEMDVWTDETGYSLCFCVVNITYDSGDRYACRYSSATLDEVIMAGKTGILPLTLVQQLDAEFSGLGQSG